MPSDFVKLEMDSFGRICLFHLLGSHYDICSPTIWSQIQMLEIWVDRVARCKGEGNFVTEPSSLSVKNICEPSFALQTKDFLYVSDYYVNFLGSAPFN